MISLSRRQLTGSVSLLGLGLLNACSGLFTPITPVTPVVPTPAPNTPASYVELIANGLAALGPELTTIAGVPATTVQQIEGYASTAATVAAQIQADIASATTPSTSTVQEIGTIVGEVAPIVLGFVPGGSVAVGIVNALIALAPIAEQAFGVVGASLKVSSLKYYKPVTKDEAVNTLSALPKSKYLK